MQLFNILFLVPNLKARRLITLFLLGIFLFVNFEQFLINAPCFNLPFLIHISIYSQSTKDAPTKKQVHTIGWG